MRLIPGLAGQFKHLIRLTAVYGAAMASAVACPPSAPASAEAQLPAASNSATSSPSNVTVQPTAAPAAAPQKTSAAWGTYQKLFAANSLWNSRPVDPILGDFVIPKSTYFPTVSAGAYSSGIFKAMESDQPMRVYGPAGKQLWMPDGEASQEFVTIPRWPSNVIPASGTDGHADIVDEKTGIVHSFFQLKNVGGTWRANQYAWTKLDGSGWGNPAQYFQGARAAGVPTSGGMIRKHEINDGDSMYRHALAMSLTFNALSPSPDYVFPATSADTGAATSNTGKIPEGALMMLPASFDTRRITSAPLRKVAETLKAYGAYVVDRNHGTPYVIYVENGADFNLHGPKWSNTVANELVLIQQSLRQVVSAKAWADGDGRSFQPEKNLNLLSMRGPWVRLKGNGSAAFDTWRQQVVFTASATPTTVAHFNNRSIATLKWARPEAGKTYELKVAGTGGATLKLDVLDKATGKVVYTTGSLGHGATATFTWPTDNFRTNVYATGGVNQAASVGASLTQATPRN